MRTTYRSGGPYGLEDLICAFAVRIEALYELSAMLEMREGTSSDAKALASGIAVLYDDWSVYDAALRDWDARENGTEYVNVAGGAA
jgi:hypothetical protein